MDELFTLEFLKRLIGTAIRNALTPAITYLVAKGWMVAEDADQLVLVIVLVVATFLWGVYQKRVAAKEVKVALALPQFASQEVLREKLKESK